MAYGLSTRAPIERRVPAEAFEATALRSTPLSWRALDEANRLALIERALRPANDCIDAFPLAL